MKKKLSLLLMSILGMSTVFTGCGLFELDTAKVLNTVVATIKDKDEKINITKEELLTAYNSYGADLVQNQNMSVEAAVKATLDVVIDRKVLLRDAKKLIIFSKEQKQKNWQDTFDAINTNLKEFEGEIKAENSDVFPNNPPAPSEDEKVIYTPFQEVVKLVEIDDRIVLKEIEKEPESELPYDEDFVLGVDGFVQQKTTEELGNLAKQRYVRLLVKNEKYYGTKPTEKKAFDDEIMRIFKNIEENMYITEYQKLYEKKFTVTFNNIIEKYVALTQQDYIMYSNNIDSYHTKMESESDAVYYHPSDEYFKVTHILIQYNETQKAEVTALKKNMEEGYITKLDYEKRLKEISRELRAIEKDEEGNVVNSSMLAEEVQKKIETEMNGQSYADKTKIFNSYIYKFNQDPGVMNAKAAYIVGKTKSKMVKEFTDISRELHKEGTVGAVSKLVPTEFGVHIIMYLGKSENLINVESADKITAAGLIALNNNNFDDRTKLLNLFNTKIYDLNNKTVLDAVYEVTKEAQIGSYETMLINQLKKNLEITKFENKYKNLWK